MYKINFYFIEHSIIEQNLFLIQIFYMAKNYLFKDIKKILSKKKKQSALYLHIAFCLYKYRAVTY